MTPDNRQPRKRRRRRRRAGAPGENPGNVAPQGQPNGNVAINGDQQPSFNDGQGGGAGRRRRNRSRRRGGHQGYSGDAPPGIPIDLPAGELAPVSGVLWIKPNGTGMLVQPANNYVPTPGDAIAR